MERNREARRVSMAAANGLASRRRHRSGSLRDSPEDDGPVELQETARLRDRGTGKKDRDRDRERERDRDRERDRERERDRDRDRDRMSSRGKRRRGDRMMHGSNREDGGNEDSSEESVNDDEDDDDDDAGGGVVGSSMRMLPPNPSSLSSSSLSNHHHRKSFPPPAKTFRASPPVVAAAGTATAAAAPWKAPDEMIGVSVPRKARSASTKRAHEWASSCGIGGEQNHRQASTSPVRSGGPSTMLASASASPAPLSPPSSSNASVKKKMKPNGPKQRPPKSSPKFTTTSSNQEEIEIEIAEVLYGMMRQPQGPTKQQEANNNSNNNDLMKFDSSRDLSNSNNNKSTGDAKSRVSSPISNSPSTLPQSSSVPPSNSSSSATPMSTIAPKRKRPRPVKYEEENPSIYPVRNNPISSTIKGDTDQPGKIETCSPKMEKNSGSTAENGGVNHNKMVNQTAPESAELQQELVKSENDLLLDSKTTQESESRRDSVSSKEEPQSLKKESPPSMANLRLDDDREKATIAKENSTVSELESQREEKFQIDLMAPPPLRSSPERDGEIDFVAVDPKPEVTNVEMEKKPAVKDDEKAVKIGKDVNAVEPEEKKAKVTFEEFESQKPTVNPIKERNIDLQLDLEKSGDCGTVTGSVNKVHHHVQKQPSTDKAQSNSLPLPMSVTSWPGGLPHMGYMAPLQGVVSMDGGTVPSAAIQPPHLLFSHPRPKRCATHCYIARNIHYHQQFTRMNPFWAAAPGSALQFGPKPCNVNVVHSTDLHTGRAMNSVQDKGQGLAIFPGHTVKDKNSQSSNVVDSAQRKQILLQQPLPPGAPSNILHGPAFIFPLNQQHAAAAAAAAASVRPGTVKSPPFTGSAASSSTSSSASMSATATGVAGATAMSFNYPNMPGNETQYLAILQNSAYPIPIPAHVGATPTYRGTAQAMPFFNGSFYSSQMIHPQQLQQQQPPTPHSQQSQQGHQNPSISSSSSSSQKHLQNQQQRPHGSGMNGGSGNFQGFPTSKSQPSQQLQLQQRQQMQNQNVPHQGRQLESEIGEDSPSTADSRVSRANMSIYGPNFALPMHPSNFALMTPTIGGATTASGNPGEKKQQQSQPQGSKVGVEPSQAFAMSFASINGATAAPSLDISSIAQSHALLQSLPEATRQGYHFMAAAVAQAAQQKNYRTEEGKTGGNDGPEDDRKGMSGGKGNSTAGQSIAFSRPDLTDTSVLTLPGNTLIDSPARTHLGSSSARATGSVMSVSISNANASSVQQQVQRSQQQQHQQQMLQLQKQHQFAAAAAASARSKTPATSNGNLYPENIPSSSSMAAKFPNSLSGFPSNLVQSSSSPTQSPQWKNSVRTSTSQVPSPSLTSTSTSLKNLPQQQGRMQQGHTQISFAANPKPLAVPQGQPASNSNQSPSPPMAVGSPTTSISKSAGGSPRTTSNSTSNKGGQSSTLSSQQAKNSPSMPAQKSSPVGGRSIPSILGHPHNSTSSASSVTKSQLAQQQQQQLPKHALQQAQMIYNNTYMQAQVQHTGGSTLATPASGFYLQRHRSEQQQQPQGSPVTSTAGMLLCPSVSLPNATTTDPAKAVAAAAAAAAAASSMKGGGLPSQGLIHAQFAAAPSSGKTHLVPAGFPYVHAVQVKPAEQKQPAAD